MSSHSTLRAVIRLLAVCTLPILLSACSTVVLNPSGDIALHQTRLLIISTFLMLLIIVPVIALTFFFAWRYRSGNAAATYSPEWDHSTSLEFVIWGAPLMIIMVLGLLTWIGTHTLDPYRKIDHIDERHRLPAGVKPLRVDVVALDWKWLFIYPDQNIATVNELAAPVDVPIEFHLTADTVMNSFFVPALVGQIYAMPGMQTTLNAIIHKPGDYDGFSANYSGAGFSDMKFRFHAYAKADFDQWVQTVRADQPLDLLTYRKLAQPSERVAVAHYNAVEPLLFHKILNRCVADGAICQDQMMAIDERATRPVYLRNSPASLRLADASQQICTTNQTSSKVVNNARTN